jgi:molybdopterin-guanine dinucleotide biosynthesis protein MobB
VSSNLPILGFVGPSGSGKTTVLEQVVALLTDAGVRLATLKHAKPGFDVDADPSKDSHRFRSAGASQVLIASRDRWAITAQQGDPLREPSLREMLRRLDASSLDAALVEGFAHEQYPKIEVYRPSQGRAPQCWPDDRSVIAVASDVPVATGRLARLDLNDPVAIARFVARRLGVARPIGSGDLAEEGLAWG